MGIKDRIGFSVFAKPVSTPLHTVDRTKLTKFHDDYGELCARINPDRESEWRSRGLDDLPVLLTVPGVAEIGVSLEHARLHILTERIHARDHAGTWRTIGEIIATYYVTTKSLSFENVTHAQRSASITGSNSVYAHPHILNGTMCFSASRRLLDLFLEARVSQAMRLLIPALRMEDFITRNTAYHEIECWPLKEGN